MDVVPNGPFYVLISYFSPDTVHIQEGMHVGRGAGVAQHLEDIPDRFESTVNLVQYK